MAANPTTPNWSSPLVDPSTGIVSTTWMRFFASLFGGSPAAITPADLSNAASPFSYTASAQGFLVVQGGTVSQITLTRARVANLDMGVIAGPIPMDNGDVVTITYTVAPNVTFIPT